MRARILLTAWLVMVMLASGCAVGRSPQPQVDQAMPAPPVGLALSPEFQALLEGASIEVRPAGEHAYTIAASLGTGDVVETTYTLEPERVDLASLAPPDRPGSPLWDFQMDARLSDQRLEWSQRFVVPVEAFPAGALSASAPAGRPAGRPAGALSLRLGPSMAQAAEGGGVKVRVEGGLNVATSVWGVLGALDLNDEHHRRLQRLAELRRCAEGASSPIRMIAEDRQKVLDAISEAEAGLKNDTAVRFIGALNSQASSVVSWLGFVVGPITGWADERIARHSEERLAILERTVAGCERPTGWSGTITYEARGEVSQKTDDGSVTRRYHYEQTATVVSTAGEGPGFIDLRVLVRASGSMSGESFSRKENWTPCAAGEAPSLKELFVHEGSHSYSLASEEEQDLSISFEPRETTYLIHLPLIGGEAPGSSTGRNVYQNGCSDGKDQDETTVDDFPSYFDSDTETIEGTYTSTGSVPSTLSGTYTRQTYRDDMTLTITVRWDLSRGQ